MRFKLLTCSICLYPNIVLADFPGPEYLASLPESERAEIDVNDLKMTAKQQACLLPQFYNPDDFDGIELEEHDCEESSRGFDTTVAPWHDYFDTETKKYRIPIFVKTSSYKANLLPTLWQSLNWARDHYLEHTNIEMHFMDEWEKDNKIYSRGWIDAFYGGQCYSYLGSVAWVYRWTRQGKGQPMDIGWCYRVPGSIVHETMHALGFVHEHMRNDRDDYLIVDSTNAANCAKYKLGRLDTGGTQYDLESIMHYGEGACGIKKRPQYRQYRIGQREKLSTLDKYEINRIYPAEGPPEKM